MIPEFPENRQNNREFFRIFGSFLRLPFVEHIKKYYHRVAKLSSLFTVAIFRRKGGHGGTDGTVRMEAPRRASGKAEFLTPSGSQDGATAPLATGRHTVHRLFSQSSRVRLSAHIRGAG
jgi:hypothetical protein